MPAGDWVRVASASDIPPGKGRFALIDNHELAVFHLTDPDRFVITRNSCPHAGGNLSAGDLEGAIITCPWHHWPFDLQTGHCTLSPTIELKRYPCKIEGGVIYARLDAI